MRSSPTLRRRRVLCGLAVLPVLSGCAGTPPRLYVLTPLEPERGARRTGNRAVGVHPVAVPDYLDRAEIVSLAGTHQLTTGRDDRWAEPLPASITRVLAANLSTLLDSDRVRVLPTRDGGRQELEVDVTVERFERTAAGDAVLDARWMILDGETGRQLVLRRTSLSAPVAADDYSTLVAVMNENLTVLSREIATAIGRLGPRGKR